MQPGQPINTDQQYSAKPDAFLVHVTQLQASDIKKYVDGLDAGYEQAQWRGEALARHLLEWIPEYALSGKEFHEFKGHNWLDKMQKAVSRVYETNKGLERRGEIGEILLHAAVRQIYNSIPIVCKVFYKTASNDTVKGWDAAHFVKNDEGQYELWLGESKFYTEIDGAFAAAVTSMKEHLEPAFLKKEREIILTLSSAGGFAIPKEIEAALHKNTSLDDVLKVLCIPVLVAYESESLKKGFSDKYLDELKEEMKKHYEAFCTKVKTDFSTVAIRLILVPMQSKQIVIDAFDSKLKALQAV